MSIKVRCTRCRRKLWVDDAFASGVCRCPHCKELFIVPAKGRGGSVRSRPETPPGHGRPSPQAEPVPGAAPRGLPSAKPVPSRKGVIAVTAAALAAAVLGAIALLKAL